MLPPQVYVHSNMRALLAVNSSLEATVDSLRNQLALQVIEYDSIDASFWGIRYSWIERHRGKSLWLAFIACTFACILSVYNIYQHLEHYSRPQLQRYIVRILAIVPVYALGALLSFQFVRHALYFDTIRDCYEAFVVYSFLVLVLSFAGGESVCVLKMQSEPEITHMWPLNRYLHPIARDGRLLRSCKRATIQFVLVKPFFAVLSLLMLSFGQYHTLPYQLSLSVVYNLSYTIALYGLGLFFLATKHILKPFNPVLKFFAVKSVIFLTFWQSSLLEMLPKMSRTERFAWKEFILCLEMFIFAILHWFAFNASQFRKENLDRMPDSEVLKNMKEVISLSDLFADAYHNFMPSYRDYMLQRADASASHSRQCRKGSVTLFGDEDASWVTPRSTGSTSSDLDEGGLTIAHPNRFIPRFVIDDEDEDTPAQELEEVETDLKEKEEEEISKIVEDCEDTNQSPSGCVDPMPEKASEDSMESN
uniref:Uncharacterized protein AlNc14C23G2341 n=1 Tax=Albugo laibachii Nc14 TaxID=890382 RepID=F0W639_9STRA|nr:conserved hypothetical protein [Albugo laibachii Nc14]|eukprot:CCA16581.1 conserved hypothetical protein [Albugo laibachii Nc14]